MRILYMPLDERPCNRKFPMMLASGCGVELITPPQSLLPDKKRPGDCAALHDFLLDQAKLCNAAVIAIDLLVYGGLIPSRLHHLGADEVLERLDVIRELRLRNPTLRIYAASTIMRAPSYDSSEEEPDYYARYGRMLFRRAWLTDRKQREGLDESEQDELANIAVPQSVIDDYEHRRSVNLAVNQACLRLVEQGAVDYLILPQDDSSPYGYTARAQRSLQRSICAQHLMRKVAMYPGSDEVGQTLVSRAICDVMERHPVIRTRYSGEYGAGIVPSYEDRPLRETVLRHIRAAGARVWDGCSGADIELLVNVPGRRMQEASQAIDGRDVTYDSYRNLPAFIDTIERLLVQERTVALADSAFANGGDPLLVDELDRDGMIPALTSYAGWNTNGNTLGTSISQAVAAQVRGTDTDRRMLNVNVAYRIIEDVFYQSIVRWQVDAQVSDHGGSYQDIGVCRRWAEDHTRNLLQHMVDETMLSKALPLQVARVSFPGRRLFEIGMNLEIT